VSGAEPVADWLEIDAILFGASVRRFVRLYRSPNL